MRRKLSFVSLAAFMLIVVCVPVMAAAEAPTSQQLSSNSPYNSPWSQWIQNKQTWDSMGIDSYEFTQINTCYCYYRELQIRVENDTVVSVKDLNTGTMLDPSNYATYTMDDYFQTILSAIWQAEIVQVQYDASYGYPSQVYIDWNSMIADEETSFTITSFNPL